MERGLVIGGGGASTALAADCWTIGPEALSDSAIITVLAVLVDGMLDEDGISCVLGAIFARRVLLPLVFVDALLLLLVVLLNPFEEGSG